MGPCGSKDDWSIPCAILIQPWSMDRSPHSRTSLSGAITKQAFLRYLQLSTILPLHDSTEIALDTKSQRRGAQTRSRDGSHCFPADRTPRCVFFVYLFVCLLFFCVHFPTSIYVQPQTPNSPVPGAVLLFDVHTTHFICVRCRVFMGVCECFVSVGIF